MEEDEDLEQFLERLGVVGLDYCGDWEGYKVYNPVFDEEHQGMIIGLPIYILEKDGKKEYVQDHRSFKIMHALPSSEEDEEEEDEEFDDDIGDFLIEKNKE